MEFRVFDPARDSIDELARMNEWPTEVQAEYATALRKRLLVPENVFVAVQDGRLAGAIIVHDAGFPFALVDGIYLRPEYRRLGTARAFGYALLPFLRARGVGVIFSHAPERLAKALQREGYRDMSPESFKLLVRTTA